MNKELEKLGLKLTNANLPLPKRLKSRIYSLYKDWTLPIKKTITGYVNFIEIWNNRLLLRTFAYTSTSEDVRYNTILIQEVCRRLEGFPKVILSNIDCWYMSGRKVDFDPSGRWASQYTYYGGINSWRFDYHDNFYDEKEVIEQLNIPYCAYHHKNNYPKLPFFQYICLYRQHPRIELLVKAGYSNMVPYVKHLNLQGKSFSSIFGIDIKWKNELCRFNLQDLRLVRKHPKLFNSYEDIQEYKSIMKRYSAIKKYLSHKTMKDYLEILTIDELITYNDYLDMAETVGRDLANKKILFPDPKELEDLHNALVEETIAFEKLIYDEGIMEVAKKLKDKEYSNELYNIIVPTTQKELIIESKVLHHCVRSYAERVANKETAILFLRNANKPKQPLYTIELKGKKVVQARGRWNRNLDSQASTFLKSWIKENQLVSDYY